MSSYNDANMDPVTTRLLDDLNRFLEKKAITFVHWVEGSATISEAAAAAAEATADEPKLVWRVLRTYRNEQQMSPRDSRMDVPEELPWSSWSSRSPCAASLGMCRSLAE
jgi:hypothetical protein